MGHRAFGPWAPGRAALLHLLKGIKLPASFSGRTASRQVSTKALHKPFLEVKRAVTELLLGMSAGDLGGQRVLRTAA